MSRVKENTEIIEACCNGDVLVDGKFRWIGKYISKFLAVFIDISKSLAVNADKMSEK